MGKRQMIFLALAAFVGIGMVLLARSLLATPDKAAAVQEKQLQVTQVLVARRNIPSGSFVAAADAEWRSWPSDSPTDGLLVKNSSSEKDYVGAVVREGFKAGEPILRARLTMPNDGGFLSAVLSPGMRAMTVKISATSGVAGLIFPNDRVDVILAQKLGAVGEDGGGDERRSAETVLENVRVLALDQKTDDQKKEPKVAELATLEVTSKQAEKLALISQMGQLSLVLRSVANEVAVDVPAKDAMNAEGVAPTVGSSAGTYTMDSEVSRVHRVQIMRGSAASEVVVHGGSQ
jgi:pilus assembly protein CpaB